MKAVCFENAALTECELPSPKPGPGEVLIRVYVYAAGVTPTELLWYPTNFEDQVRDLDVVFDGVGGETLQRSWKFLKPDGRMVTIAAGISGTQDTRTREAFFIVEPNRAQLTELASRIDSGKLKPVIDGVVPLVQASSAYLGSASRKNGRGKFVVEIVQENSNCS